MLTHEDEYHSTLLFCRSRDDGTVAPDWHASREAELRGQFEVGLTVAGRYLLHQRLGRGAMGCVFLARDLRLDRLVAIKVVSHPREPRGELDTVLEREAKLGASLNHKGIAAVYDFGFVDRKSFTVFEYVEGETLRELLRRRGRIPLAESVQIVQDLAAALDFAHLQGVVHRDLKPENVCFTKRGEFKILDLGLARDIKRDMETASYAGTPAYSSPEQAQCRPTDGRSDQYALALIAYEMLTGLQAFVETDPLRLLRKQIEEAPPRPTTLQADLPLTAERAILRALSKTPEDRFPNCQQFARELAGELDVSGRRHVLVTPVEKRLAFYVAHVAEQSRLARQIAEHLERKGFACWCYGRDALPGVPFTSQAHGAIERSQAAILLVSRTALRAADVAREVEHAHRIGAPLLTLLIDLSREEFEKLAPSWCRMLGTSPLIEILRHESSLDKLLDRVLAAARALDITAERPLVTAKPEPPARCAGQIWATDANQIDIHDLDRVLFRNDTIDQFLYGKHRHFVVATKGFGKTLLLTRKRQLLADADASPAQALTMIPEGRPYLDFMSELRSLSARYEQPLSDLSNTTRLWSTALRISAISHHPGILEPGEEGELAAFPERIRRWLHGAKIQPTVVFKELITLRVGELNRLIDRTENFLDQKMRQLHSGTCFFIDKVDQAIQHLSRDAWIAIQAGLIEASWEAMNTNSHLKVYASIRLEAFANYQSDIKANLFAATTTLNYSDDELHALLDQLARCYEGCQTFADFLGLNVVRHGRRPAPEDSFQYVRRHTCGRPRDLVAIASEISSKRRSLNERRLREIVQQTSSAVLVSNIFDEVRVLLNCLGQREARVRFLSLIPANILEKEAAVRVCESFNGLEPGTLQHFADDSPDLYHPFRDLFYAGLLGVLEHDVEQGIIVQRFRRPDDMLAHGMSDLPDSPVFLIHPALDDFIRALRTRDLFLQYQYISIGQNLVWESYFPIMMQIERYLQSVPDRGFVESVHQVLKRIQTLLNTGSHPLARVEIECGEAWRTFCRHEDRPEYDDVLYWLGELLEYL